MKTFLVKKMFLTKICKENCFPIFKPQQSNKSVKHSVLYSALKIECFHIYSGQCIYLRCF